MDIVSTGVDPAVVTVTGEVDLATAPQLEQALGAALDQSGVTGVDVNLSGVEFMDSAGLRVLVTALHQAERVGVPLRLREPHDRVLRIIEITGLAEVFGLTDADQG